MAGNGQDDFEALARRYWAAWGDALRAAMPDAGAAPGMPGMATGGMPGMTGVPGMGAMPGLGGLPGAMPPAAQAWHEAIDWWTRYAHGGRGEVNDALSRFNTQARQWYGQMQQVAAQFAGQDAKAADITQAWKQALGAVGDNPFPEMLRGLRGQGLQGLDKWVEDASPYLDAMRSEGNAWLGMPTFGFAREHQERLQRLAAAQLEYQQQSSAYNALMAKASQEAYGIFEGKLAEREEPGRQLESPRALFDLWIDAAEEAYARIALSPEFREVYGNLVNAQMRLRAGVQREVEQASAQLGMPTRSEVDGAYRKIAELERALRRLRDEAGQGGKAGSREGAKAAQSGGNAPARAAKGSKTGKAAAGKPKATKPAAAAHAPAKAAPRRTAVRKAAPAPATRTAPTNGFSSMIPAAIPQAPAPLDAGAARPKTKGKR